MTVELPFTLTHPKPASPSPSPVVQRRYSEITQGKEKCLIPHKNIFHWCRYLLKDFTS